MKLTVLGCWAPYPKAGGACSGYLVQDGPYNILLECGNGVLSNLQKYVDFRSLSAVIVSHLHPDHYLDLHCLRYAIGGVRRNDKQLKPVPLYLPAEPVETFGQLSGFTEAFEIRPINQLTTVQVGGSTVRQAKLRGIDLSFIRTDHPKPAYAVRIEGDGHLFFSADTKWTGYLPAFAKGVDLALCEASVIEQDKEYTSVGHLTAQEAGQLAEMAGAARLVITHFWPDYNLDTIVAEAEKGFGRPVIAAREGLVVEFGRGK